MSKNNIAAGLDIGTSSIKLLLAEKELNQPPRVIFQAEEKAFGMRKGTVVAPEEVRELLNSLILRAKQEAGLVIDSVFVNANGNHIFCLPSRGSIVVSRADTKISEEDINRVLQSAQTVSLGFNKEIFDVSPREFIIDGQKGIKDALGLQGVRLEAEVLLLGGFSPYLKNLSNAILKSDLQVSDIIPSPLAASRSVLSPRQKELGTAVLDIGFGTTGLAVFEEGNLIHLAILPMGSANITNDIATGLKIDVETAEKIKIELGSCSIKGGSKKRVKEKIKLTEGDESIVFSHRALNTIIEARVREIFEQVQKELKKISKEKLLPGGIVLCGGGAKLSNIVELARKELKLPCKIGKPRDILDLEEDTSWAVVSGLVFNGLDSEEEGSSAFGGFTNSVGGRIKKIFKSFLP